jgi:hypothetical protein
MRKIKISITPILFIYPFLFASLVTVDQSGKGDYTTIQAAINSKADTLFIKNGEYFEKISINDNGRFVIIGESRDGVIINNPNDNSFYIINNSVVQLENLTVENGKIGSNDDQSYSYYTIKIIRCVIKVQVSLSVDGALTAKNSIFLNYPGTMIYDAGNSINYHGSVLIENCIFYNVATGNSNNAVSLYAKPGTIINTLFYRTYRGIWGNKDLYVSYCAFDRATDDVNNTNPLWSSWFSSDDASKLEDVANSDYRLKSDSPLINMGSPVGTYNDNDGTRNDIGVYGGPLSWNPAPLIKELSISSSTIQQGSSVTINAKAKSK